VKIERDGKVYRIRRGKMVEVPPEWVGKTVGAQTINTKAQILRRIAGKSLDSVTRSSGSNVRGWLSLTRRGTLSRIRQSPSSVLHKQKSGLGVRSSSRGDAGDHGRAGRMAIAA